MVVNLDKRPHRGSIIGRCVQLFKFKERFDYSDILEKNANSVVNCALRFCVWALFF
jgi:hypothetical protein